MATKLMRLVEKLMRSVAKLMRSVAKLMRLVAKPIMRLVAKLMTLTYSKLRHSHAVHKYTHRVTANNAEHCNSACGERIFIFRASLELHMIDEFGEGQNEIKIWCFKKNI